jgi:hypothetical protein
MLAGQLCSLRSYGDLDFFHIVVVPFSKVLFSSASEELCLDQVFIP